jgi:hypothetical protein
MKNETTNTQRHKNIVTSNFLKDIDKKNIAIKIEKTIQLLSRNQSRQSFTITFDHN